MSLFGCTKNLKMKTSMKIYFRASRKKPYNKKSDPESAGKFGKWLKKISDTDPDLPKS